METNEHRAHPSLGMVVTVLVVVCVLSLVAIPFSSPAHASTPGVQECPSGHACIYEQCAYDASVQPLSCLYTWASLPTNNYYYYGVYQLQNQYGWHLVYNSQTDNAKVWLCYDWYGNNCPWLVSAGSGSFYNLTPINSIKLTP